MTAQFPTQRLNGQRFRLAGFLTTAFAAGILTSILLASVQAPPIPRGGGTAVANVQPTPNEYAAYRATSARLAAAVARHDWSTAAQYSVILDGQLTQSAIEGLYADRGRLLRNLAAAEARGDRRLSETFKAQLAGLCPAVTTQSMPSFCK